MPEQPGHTETIAVRVVEAISEAEDTMSFVLASESGEELPEWSAGAHIDLLLPNDIVRQYSLCGDPADRRHWRVAVLREPESRGGSSYLHENVRAGSVLKASAPRNNFELHSGSKYVFIAGGIGITPLLPMIREVQARGADWHLYYGGRVRSRMAFVAELAEFGDRVTIHPEQECGLLPLSDILGSQPDEVLVYCCGPEPLLAAVEKEWAGRPSGSLRLERFRPKDTGPLTNETFDVELVSSGRRIAVGADQSILDALSKAGLDLPFSCREGTCASCETDVVEGEIEHRDSILSEEERESGKTMMICVSRAQSGRLVLDL